MTATLGSFPVFRALDANGAPLVGGLLYSFSAGTLTPLATYVDAAGVTTNANPVVLDSTGSANVWFGSSAYKLVLKTSTGSTLWTVDNYQPESAAATLRSDLASTASTALGDALVGVLPTFSGAVATTDHQINEETVGAFRFFTPAQIADVTSGSGALDVTTALQAGINYAQSKHLALELPAGAYKTTDALTISNAYGLTMRGAGINATIIRITTTGKCGLQGGALGIPGPVSNIDKVTLEDFSLVGSAGGNPLAVSGTVGTTSHGINMLEWHHYDINRVGVWFFGGDGLHLDEAYIGDIHNCSLAGNGGWGIWSGLSTSGIGYSSHAMVANSNEIQGNKTGGIYIEGPSAPQILNNRIEANSNVGVDMVYAKSFSITGNYMESNGAYHIRVGNGSSSAGPALGGVVTANNIENAPVSAGSFVPTSTYTITSVGSTNFMAIGASANTVGVVFTATGAGSGSGDAVLGTISGGIYVNNAYAVNVFGNFLYKTVIGINVTSNSHNCFVGVNHTTDTYTLSSSDSIFIAGTTFTAPTVYENTWVPTPASLTGTGITYSAKYIRWGNLVSCWVRVAGTSMGSTTDVTTLSLPFTAARIALGNVVVGGSVTTGATCLVTGTTVILPTFAGASNFNLDFTIPLS